MTSPTTTTSTEQLFTPGRTVRDIVEYSHELVNEVWCRKILRQILQALELCYAKQQPHPAITPDSIALQGNGDAVLLSTATLPIENPSEPDDLRALAFVIHYAITQELAPEGPLRGRALAGYSDSLVSAVDRCMAADPTQRPQHIEQLRNMLGIVSLGPPLPQKPSAPAFATTPAPAPTPAPTPAPAPVPAAPAAVARPPAATGSALGRLQRWLMIGAAVSVLVLCGLGLYTLLKRDQPDDNVVLSLPAAERSGAAVTGAAPAATADTEAAAGPSEALVTLPPEEAGAAQAAAEAQVAAAASGAEPGVAHAAGTTYKLLIKPWGTVYVNGVERGVSPPLKRLVLPAGEHTIRLVNPNFPDRVIKLASGKSRSGRITHNFAGRSN
jgi:hypothetical protein